MPNNSIALEPLLKVISPGGENVKFDVTKFNWIGSVTQEIYVTIAWHTVAARTIDDLRRTEILTGSTGSAGEAVALPRMLNALAGTKLKLVKGYAGQSDIFLAMERGEVQANTTGLTNLTSSKADWLQQGKIRVLVQYATEPSPVLKGVPLITDFIATDEDREVLRFFLSKYRMARLLMAPPDVPADRVQTLRTAFDATMTDPAFLEESAKAGLRIEPQSGADVTATIQKLYTTPKPIVERTRAILLSE
jgi:tripartite-type tricarboxylate transporter receptor subunit TctC